MRKLAHGIIVEGEDSVATVTTFEESLSITSGLYSGTAKTLTAAENSFAVAMTGGATAAYLIGGSGADTLTSGENGGTLDGGAFVTVSKNKNVKSDLTKILKAFKKGNDVGNGFCVVNLDADIKSLIDKDAAKTATFSTSSGGNYSKQS